MAEQAFAGWVLPSGGGPGTGPWVTYGGTVVGLATLTDTVAIGTTTMPAVGIKLSVDGPFEQDEAASKFFRVGTADAFARQQMWFTETSSVLRMGADTADGDAFDADSEGIVVYHTSDDHLGRMKADRFGLTRASDSSLYYFRVDETALFYRADPPGGTVWFNVDRSTGLATIRGSENYPWITNAALAVDPTNDYDIGSGVNFRISTSVFGGISLTGIAAGVDGQVITLVNWDTELIALINESVSSAAANRFLIAGGSNISLAQDHLVTLSYDATSARWRVVSVFRGGFF